MYLSDDARAVFDAMREGITIIDTEGRIVFGNRAYREFLNKEAGGDIGPIEGCKLRELRPGARLPGVLEAGKPILHITRQEMQAVITRNVALQKNRLLQLVPAPLKNLSMAVSYRIVGCRPYSTTYTNPGAFPVPPEMAPHIQRMEVILGQSYTPRANCASISYGNTMEITFAGTVKETDVERDFFRFLVKAGIPVRIESNRTH